MFHGHYYDVKKYFQVTVILLYYGLRVQPHAV